MFVKGLAIHGVGNQDLSQMKCGIDLGQRKHNLIAIGTGHHHVISECFAAEIISNCAPILTRRSLSRTPE